MKNLNAGNQSNNLECFSISLSHWLDSLILNILFFMQNNTIYVLSQSINNSKRVYAFALFIFNVIW